MAARGFSRLVLQDVIRCVCSLLAMHYASNGRMHWLEWAWGALTGPGLLEYRPGKYLAGCYMSCPHTPHGPTLGRRCARTSGSSNACSPSSSSSPPGGMSSEQAADAPAAAGSKGDDASAQHATDPQQQQNGGAPPQAASAWDVAAAARPMPAAALQLDPDALPDSSTSDRELDAALMVASTPECERLVCGCQGMQAVWCIGECSECSGAGRFPLPPPPLPSPILS